jgi:[acyl-carrier-protein] S-malonyltransferase
MRKIAFLYPGQGAQSAGMGKDFYEKSSLAAELYDRASELLELDVPKLCFEENDLLDHTSYTQPALVTTCLAMTRVLRQEGIQPDITAGLSLGEYAAIAAAGGFSEEEAIRLVRKRGILMENGVPRDFGGMCAILALDEKIIEAVLADMEDVTIANYNCPGQIVITGRRDAVEAAAEKLKAAGARRTMMLKVDGPFHSPFLSQAGEELRADLDKVAYQPLKVPYVTNVTAEEVRDIAETPQLLCQQVSSPVRFMQSLKGMLENGVDCFIEIGPGKTLTGFLRKIDRQVQVYNVSSFEDVQKVKEALHV